MPQPPSWLLAGREGSARAWSSGTFVTARYHLGLFLGIMLNVNLRQKTETKGWFVESQSQIQTTWWRSQSDRPLLHGAKQCPRSSEGSLLESEKDLGRAWGISSHTPPQQRWSRRGSFRVRQEKCPLGGGKRLPARPQKPPEVEQEPLSARSERPKQFGLPRSRSRGDPIGARGERGRTAHLSDKGTATSHGWEPKVRP